MIGEVLQFSDTRITVLKVYPGQVKCKLEECVDGKPTGSSRTKTLTQSQFEGFRKAISDARKHADRYVKIMRDLQNWETADFDAVRAGDVFVVFEPDGREVPGGPWMARGSPYKDAAGNSTIDCDPLEIKDIADAHGT